jgi:mono/diheme cytochrome c family protein
MKRYRAINMGRALLFLAVMAVMAVVLWASQASANGYGYTRSYNYNTVTYPAYEPWQWGKYPTDNSYFVRWRWVTYNYGNRTWETDGKLYTRDASGNYAYYRNIADYKAKGDAVGGIEAVRKEIAKVHIGIARLADLQKSPDAIDPRDYLPDPNTLAEARQRTEELKFELITKSNERVALADIEREKENDKARNILALEAARLNSLERALKSSNQATADAFIRSQIAAHAAEQGEEAADINVDTPGLASLIATRCYSCHGGAKGASGGLDFKDAASFTSDQWLDCHSATRLGDMPKGGPELSADEIALFKKEAKSALARE